MKKFFLWAVKVFLLTAITWAAGYVIIILLFTIGNTHSIFGTIFAWSLPLFLLTAILTLTGRLSYAGLLTKDEYKTAGTGRKVGLYLWLLIPAIIAIIVLISML